MKLFSEKFYVATIAVLAVYGTIMTGLHYLEIRDFDRCFRLPATTAMPSGREA